MFWCNQSYCCRPESRRLLQLNSMNSKTSHSQSWAVILAKAITEMKRSAIAKKLQCNSATNFSHRICTAEQPPCRKGNKNMYFYLPSGLHTYLHCPNQLVRTQTAEHDKPKVTGKMRRATGQSELKNAQSCSCHINLPSTKIN